MTDITLRPDRLPPDTREVERLAGGFIRFMETLSDTDAVFGPGTFFDVNVPMWRLQMEGGAAFEAWLRTYNETGYRIPWWRSVPTATGVAVELEGEYEDRAGAPQYFRNLFLFEIDGGRIADVTMYCTGDWDEETRRQHAASAPLVRR